MEGGEREVMNQTKHNRKLERKGRNTIIWGSEWGERSDESEQAQ